MARDVMIYQSYLGDGLMGVGLTREQADEDALREGRASGVFGPGMDEAGGFATEEDYFQALSRGVEWLSHCSASTLEALEWRDIEEEE